MFRAPFPTRDKTTAIATPRQLVEELLTFWSLEDYETTLEELEEVLIVSVTRGYAVVTRGHARAGRARHVTERGAPRP